MRRPHARPRERGVALLLVLWVFMVLGVLALDFARFMRDDAMAGLNFAEETHGYYVALAGLNRALFDFQQVRENDAAISPGGRTPPGVSASDEPPLVPPDAQWHEGEFAGARWAVRMTDEGALVSLNRASGSLLRIVVRNLLLGPSAAAQGMDRRTQTQVDTVVDSILDWRDSDDLERQSGAETDTYARRRPSYDAKNGFFDAPEELLLVRGVTPELYYGQGGLPGLRDVVSVYGRTKRINLRFAKAPVLQAVVGIDAETAAELIRQRDEDAIPLRDSVLGYIGGADPGLADLLVDEEPRVVFIEARADVARPRNQARVAAVASISEELADSVRILRWFDRAPWTGVLPGGPVGTTAEGLSS